MFHRRSPLRDESVQDRIGHRFTDPVERGKWRRGRHYDDFLESFFAYCLYGGGCCGLARQTGGPGPTIPAGGPARLDNRTAAILAAQALNMAQANDVTPLKIAPIAGCLDPDRRQHG
jgi:hypothetical protein